MKALSDHLLSDAFDPIGVNLVEASAGTGKTYSIETLYLILVVKHGIPVDELLVVTFTEAATGELRGRIRKILESTRRSLESSDLRGEDKKRDERIDKVLHLSPLQSPGTPEPYEGHDLQLRRIRRALLDFDMAAIFTIHGFCQRTLNEFAFECRLDFDSELITGDAMLTEICTDRWRSIVYKKPENVLDEVVIEQFPSPADLLKLAQAYLKRHGAILLPDTDLDQQHQDLAFAIGSVLSVLHDHKDDIIADLRSPESKPFFKGNVHEICEKIDKLYANGQRNPSLDRERISLGNSLLKLLSPSQNNPGPPSGVLACVAACDQCLSIAKENQIKYSKRTRSLTLSEDCEEAWGQALDDAISAIRHNRTSFNDFQKLCRKYPDLVPKALSIDEEIWQEWFESICKRTPEKVMDALKGVAKIKLKASKTHWQPEQHTQELRNALNQLHTAASAPIETAKIVEELHVIHKLYRERKLAERGMTFDDMLTRLLEALEAQPGITSTIGEAYQAALIDEFQDTDPVQYNIFRRLFIQDKENLTSDIPVFFVGDPKQAIYSFRGGDIYTYSTAKEWIDNAHQYGLDTNYRSQALLIEAVNAIFGKDPFGHHNITYDGNLGCKDLGERFCDAGELDAKPFKVWQYIKPDDAKWSLAVEGNVMKMVCRDVATEIVKLLNDPNTGFIPNPSGSSDTGTPDSTGSIRRLKPSDVAILVRRHKEAAQLYHELVRRGVPAVRQAADNVFDSSEATELGYVLSALQDPTDLQIVRTAIASHLIPVSDQELHALSAGRSPAFQFCHDESGTIPDVIRCGLPEKLDDWIELFREANARWEKRGIQAAMSYVISCTGMKGFLASQPGGERKLVNVGQLIDLLHQATTENILGPATALAWYTRQCNADTRDSNDAFETRLESDDDAVQIMTIFKSKGLEFPVVFVPGMWTSLVGLKTAKQHFYHDEQDDPKAHPPLYMHLDMKDEKSKESSLKERFDEDVRNFYVATTRASFRTYVVTGDLCEKNPTLARCLPEEWLNEIKGSGSAYGIEVIEKSDPASDARFVRDMDITDTLCVKGDATVDKSRGHASFSSISPHGKKNIPTAERIEPEDYDSNDDSGHELTAIQPDHPKGKQVLDIFSFAAGKHTGECWHRIFELLDFGAGDVEIRSVVEDQLGMFRLDKGSNDTEKQRKRDVVFDMVKNVLSASLRTDMEPIRLCDVPPTDKLAEMAFDFSLQGSGGGGSGQSGSQKQNAIWQVLHEAWQETAPDSDEKTFLARLDNWTREIPGGFMTGFIDLVFRHRTNGTERYYILDWKSNRLHGDPRNFARSGLVAEMAENAYFLQYLIYSVALDRYLRQSLPDYDYDRHFGGVFYLFVRGISPGSQDGIYFNRPSVRLIRKLSAALGSRQEDM